MTKSIKALVESSRSLASWGDDAVARKIAENRELVEAVNKEAAARWEDPSFHREVAAILAENLDYGFVFNMNFGPYLDVATVGEFEKVYVRERRGLKVFYTSRGGYIEESQLRTDLWELPRDTMGFHVSEHEDKLRANFGETMADLVRLGATKMQTEVVRRQLTLMQAAIPATSPYYVTTPDLTKEVLDTAIREVRDAIRPSGQGPQAVNVVGRAIAIDQISDFDGFADEAKEEIRLRGRLGRYKGANIVELVNYTDDDDEPFSPANEVWVFGGNAGRFRLYGGTRVKTWAENTVDYVHYRARRDIGGLVNHPEMVRRIILSNVPADA
jgi:hypothetical protein